MFAVQWQRLGVCPQWPLGVLLQASQKAAGVASLPRSPLPLMTVSSRWEGETLDPFPPPQAPWPGILPSQPRRGAEERGLGSVSLQHHHPGCIVPQWQGCCGGRDPRPLPLWPQGLAAACPGAGAAVEKETPLPPPWPIWLQLTAGQRKEVGIGSEVIRLTAKGVGQGQMAFGQNK